MSCDKSNIDGCSSTQVSAEFPTSIIRLLRYLKDPVLNIHDLYGLYKDGGELGWFAYVISSNKWATWDLENKKWIYIDGSNEEVDSIELNTVDDNSLFGKSNIDIYTDIQNRNNTSTESFTLHLNKNTTSGIFNIEQSIDIKEDETSKKLETTTEHSFFYKNITDSSLTVRFPKGNRYIYFNTTDNIVTIKPNQIVKVLIKALGTKRIIQASYQCDESYIRKPQFEFTADDNINIDYKSQTVDIGFKSNAKIIDIILTSGISCNILIENESYKLGDIVPFDLRKNDNQYSGVIVLNIPTNNSINSIIHKIFINASIDSLSEQKECIINQDIAPSVFTINESELRFNDSTNLNKELVVTSSIGDVFADFSIESNNNWFTVRKNEIKGLTQTIVIICDENKQTLDKEGYFILKQKYSDSRIVVKVSQNKASISVPPEIEEQEEKTMYLVTAAQYQIYGCNWDAPTLEFGKGNPNIGTYTYRRIGEYEWMTQNLKMNPVPGRAWDPWVLQQSMIDDYVPLGIYDPMTVEQSLQYEGGFFGAGTYKEVDAFFYNTKFYADSTQTTPLQGWKQPNAGDFAQLFAMADSLDYDGIIAYHGVEKGNPKYPFKNDWENIAKNKSGFSMIPSGTRNNASGQYANPRRACAFKTDVDNGSIIRLEPATLQPVSLIRDDNSNLNSVYPNASIKFHLVSVRYCRPLTDEELGYKMYVDEANDQIKVVPINQEQPKDLVELEKGKLRGRAVRWLNAEKTKVLVPLSTLNQELLVTQNGGSAAWFDL